MADPNQVTEPFVLPSDLEEQRSVVERQDYKPKPSFRLPSEQAPEKPNYAEMPISEVAYRGLSSAGPSLVNLALGIPNMVMHPSETWEGIKSVGKGMLSSAAENEISALESGAAGETGKKLAADWRARDKRTPEQKQDIEEPWNRFTAPYTSVAGLKEAIATDPFSVIPIAGGPLKKLGSLVRGEEGANLARKVIAAPITAAGYAADPVEGALSLTGTGMKKLGSGIKSAASGFTQVPEEALDIAYTTGKSRGPQADLAKQSFQTWFNNAGDVNEFATRASNAFKSIKNDAWNAWKNQKQGVVGQPINDVPFEPALKSIQEKIDTYGPYGLAQPETQKAIDTLEKIKRDILDRALLPSGHEGRSIEGLDQLKIQLGREASANPSLYGDYMAAYHGIKDSINQVAPEYQSLMDSYRAMDREMLTIQKSIKAKDTNTALQSLDAFNKLLKTPEGIKIAKMINDKDPTILPAVAGAALSKDMPKLQGILDKTGIGGAILTTIGSIAMGYPKTAAIAMGAVPALAAVQTPRNLGKVAYTAGQVAGTPAGKAAVGVGQFARQTASPSAMFMQNLQMSQQDLENYPIERNQGGRVARANGGRIDAMRGARALMRAAENAKKDISKTTEPLLEQPDEHIAQALNMAKRHI